jgi:hypothetical protein
MTHWKGDMKVRVAPCARKHRISRTRILAAMASSGPPQLLGDRLLYIGVDDRGVELEVIGVADDKERVDLVVIHAMPTRWRGNHD